MSTFSLTFIIFFLSPDLLKIYFPREAQTRPHSSTTTTQIHVGFIQTHTLISNILNAVLGFKARTDMYFSSRDNVQYSPFKIEPKGIQGNQFRQFFLEEFLCLPFTCRLVPTAGPNAARTVSAKQATTGRTSSSLAARSRTDTPQPRATLSTSTRDICTEQYFILDVFLIYCVSEMSDWFVSGLFQVVVVFLRRKWPAPINVNWWKMCAPGSVNQFNLSVSIFSLNIGSGFM